MAAVISLLTDFGSRDPYVGEMKGRILGVVPEVALVDLTHELPPGDVAAGGFLLARSWGAFPGGTIHLAVVDPGVGTDRAPLAVHSAGHWFVGPDNGLLSMAAPAPTAIWRLDPSRVSDVACPAPTFHGRDVFAPAAARLARHDAVEDFATPAPSMTGLEPVVEVLDDRVIGEVMWVDHFGNAITAIREEQVRALGEELEVRVAGLRLRELHRTFGEVAPLTPLAYVGGGGTLELAVRDGDLSERFGVRRGTRVELRVAGGS